MLVFPDGAGISKLPAIEEPLRAAYRRTGILPGGETRFLKETGFLGCLFAALVYQETALTA
ncbi:hypothetical protein [Kamptonema formosum]|uniref:hypothetical protein n=1 Tax=Kamptonema formosum TaxID=331992 RepID=UPI00034612E3|nr:hypothetical protein [Oscillatoria sp. PCC 10802]